MLKINVNYNKVDEMFMKIGIEQYEPFGTYPGVVVGAVLELTRKGDAPLTEGQMEQRIAIESAIGMKLYPWQVRYIWQGGDYFFPKENEVWNRPHGAGRTTMHILKNLLDDTKTLDFRLDSVEDFTDYKNTVYPQFCGFGKKVVPEYWKAYREDAKRLYEKLKDVPYLSLAKCIF